MDLPRTLVELADRAAAEHGGEVALLFEGESYTRSQLREKACAVAEDLQVRGLKPGECVATHMSNCPEVFISLEGILRAGGVAVPLVDKWTKEEVAPLLDETGARFLFTGRGTLEERRAPAPAAKLPEGAAAIIYTSGTTGRMRGAVLTHRALVVNSYCALENGKQNFPGLAPPRVTKLMALPLAHAAGLAEMCAAYWWGNENVLMPRWSPRGSLELIAKHQVRRAGVVPAMMQMMVDLPAGEGFDTSSVLVWGTGSAPMPAGLQEKFEARFGGKVLQAYGMSEAGPGICAERAGERRPGSVGRVLPKTLPLSSVIEIVDEEERPLPRGQTGQVRLTGESLFSGYFARPEETAQVLRDGWLYTGDLGRIDQEGFLYIEGRLKDVIIRGGENVSPSEVEAVLLEHPLVHEAAVVGVPDPVLGEAVLAAVVPESRDFSDATALLLHCKGRLAPYKCPTQIRFLESLPRNAIGKVLKREIIAQAAREKPAS